MKKNLFYLFVLFLSLSVFSCGKDTPTDNNNTNNNNGDDSKITPPQVTEVKTSISNTNTDPYAQSVKSLVEGTAGLYTGLMTAYITDGFPWKKSGNTWTYVITSGTTTLTYQLVDQGTSYKFSYIINGTLDNQTVSNFTFYESTYNKDNKSGNWKIYDLKEDKTSYLSGSYEWIISASNAFTGTLNFYDSAKVNTEKTVSVVNADKSGTYTVFINALKYSFYAWNVDGSGHVDNFDTDGTTITSTNVWAANP